MPTDEADPIALAPDAWSDGDLGVQLYTHLEVTLQLGFRNGERLRGRRGGALEAVDHGIEIAFLVRLCRSVLGRCAIDRFMQDGIVRVMLLHGVKIGRALEEMGPLATGIFGPNGLAVDALCGETLWTVSAMPPAGWECRKRSYLVGLLGSELDIGSMDVSVPDATHFSYLSHCSYNTGLVTVVGDWIRTE